MVTLKILVSGPEAKAMSQEPGFVAGYDAFVVRHVDEATARALGRLYPVEDISDQYRVRLGGAEVDPLSPPVPATTARTRARAASVAAVVDDSPHHHLVQFIGPIKSEWLTALKKAGATLRGPGSGFTQVVKADGTALAAIKALPFVRWSGHLPHADRVAAGLAGPADGPQLPRRRTLPGALRVEVFDKADIDRIADAAQALGFTVVHRDKAASQLQLRVEMPAQQLHQQVQALSAVHGVRWIGQRVIPRTSNHVAAGLVGQSQVSRPAPGLGLSGEGEIVAVCDTGLDSGNPQQIHADFAGRVVAVRSYPVAAGWAAWVTNAGADDGAADLDSGHGTHVAGSVLGDGAASATSPVRVTGMAPKAKLVFQAVEQEVRWRPGVPGGDAEHRFQLAGLPDNLTPLFQFAYDQGARIHSNSWGGGDPGAYDAQSRQFDDFVWRRKDMCFVIAAGNDGSDPDAAGQADGRINPGSVSSPGTAKNCITVGASENRRPEFNHHTYGSWWPNDFPLPPQRDDPMANRDLQVVAFSSRGPTSDGRVKPDVVAPGTFILSTRSTRLAPNNFAWGAWPANNRYFHMGGTSMATPITSGCVALLRQYLRTQRGVASPSAALLKALLIAGAQRLPGQAPATALLDNAQGYGRVDLDRSLKKVLLTTDAPGLRTGQLWQADLSVTTRSRDLRIVLAYSDFPGEGLVNNLNLIVTSPDGRRTVGNQRVGSGQALVLDDRNNVEVVQANKAKPGTWRVEVVASNVAQGPQDFALVALLV